MLTSADAGWSSTQVPDAAPEHYFEAQFEASAGTTYQLWLRMRGAGPQHKTHGDKNSA